MSRNLPRRLVVNILLVCAVIVALHVLRPITSAVAACPVNQQPCGSICISEKQLCILEPVPGGAQVVDPGGGPLQLFFDYINAGLWQWAFMIGVAIAVLNAVIGGLQIVTSNGDSGKVDAGKTRFLSSTMGLIMLLLAGVILEFINPFGFSAV